MLRKGFLYQIRGFLCLDLFVFKLNLDFIWISLVFALMSFFFFLVPTFSLGSLIAFS